MHAFRGRNVLVTGGLGFLGSNLVRALLPVAARVSVVDALVPGHGGLRHNLDGVADRARVVLGDVRDSALLRELVSGQDVVFSFSGQTSHLDSMEDPETDLEHNCRGPLAVLEACRKAAPEAKVVFASTRQVYGRPRRLPVDERHPLEPVDVNGIHKAAGEAYHLLYHRIYDLPVSVLRLPNCYGPRMRVRDARQTFLGWWIRQLLEGEAFAVFGGSQRRDLVYVDDALRAFLMAALDDEATGEVFNLGDSRTLTLLELAQLLVDLHGEGKFDVVPMPPDREKIDIGDYQGDFAKIERALGWHPAVTVEDGLARTIAYFEAHGRHYWDDG